jgi:hypothetical protein
MLTAMDIPRKPEPTQPRRDPRFEKQGTKRVLWSQPCLKGYCGMILLILPVAIVGAITIYLLIQAELEERRDT